MKCEIGIRAHDLPIFDDLDELAKELKSYGFDNVQFSPKFSLKENTNDGQKMSYGLAHYAEERLKQRNIKTAILGCYVNIIHPDLQERDNAIKLFQNYLSFAKAMACPLVATETGSIDNIFKPHSENWTDTVFELTVSQIKKLTNTAEKLGMLVGIEPGINHPIYDVSTTKELLDKIASPNLKIIFDPTNLVLKPTDSEAAILKNGIEAFGNEIYAFHIKDFAFNKNGEKVIVPFGDGLAPMKEMAKIIKSFRPCSYVLMEETPQAHFDRSVARFKKLFY
ncbi:sugar phosphate isomerase/epimerase family protein [Lactobacillus melliventris]|uniref:sugar phosphate isomerase/epimerase family protein n=1 Tax=Lactobacillus melliventris TaxID=1218507 RepID=UPI00164FBE65|nr:sugar phosphate isomerase/epimerase [Lactobacillus melliventris]MBC6350166.1 sugar phosphate isomerase/epimerase [Lactobacillus melliventris]